LLPLALLSWVFTLILVSFEARAADKPTSILAKRWNGQLFDEKEGGAYVAFKFDGFLAPDGSNHAPESAEVTVKNILTEQYYLFQQGLESRFGPPSVIWRLPSGKYEVVRIVAVDLKGQMRFWSGDAAFPKRILVVRRSISNLGRWTMSPGKPKELRLVYDATENRYHYEKNGDGIPPVAGVIDGFKALVQEVIGGKKTINANRQTPGVVVVPEHQSRTIQMLRTVDLMRQNRFAKKLSTLLSAYDGEIRDCYREMLDASGDASGAATFAFLLGREAARMKKVKFETGELDDPMFVGCVVARLQEVSLPLEETVIGKLTYSFKVTYE
jgi:hypothetical protein